MPWELAKEKHQTLFEGSRVAALKYRVGKFFTKIYIKWLTKIIFYLLRNKFLMK